MRLMLVGRTEPAISPTAEVGRELGYLMPAGVVWEQVRYGQGEGALFALGVTWGFYWESTRVLFVDLEAGSLPAATAFRFATQVGARLFGADAYAVVLSGVTDR